MALTIPNHRGWKQRQLIAKSKADRKSDPIKIARGTLLGAMHRRDAARGDVQRAEDAVLNAANQITRLEGTVASTEAWSVGAMRLHPGLVTARMQVDAAREIHQIAEASLDAARSRLTVAEAAFQAASGLFEADTSDAAKPAPATIEPMIAAPVASVARVPATIDAGVALDRDSALASLDATLRRGRRR